MHCDTLTTSSSTCSSASLSSAICVSIVGNVADDHRLEKADRLPQQSCSPPPHTAAAAQSSAIDPRGNPQATSE